MPTTELGLAFHRDSYMMAMCICGFTVQGFGPSAAKASYRLKRHQERCAANKRLATLRVLLFPEGGTVISSATINERFLWTPEEDK